MNIHDLEEVKHIQKRIRVNLAQLNVIVNTQDDHFNNLTCKTPADEVARNESLLESLHYLRRLLICSASVEFLGNPV